jgi:hypothetical protein
MMARRMIFIVACLCIATAAFGQRVTRTFNDVSMSEALKWLNERGGEYNISFLYNELEDFRVTTSVKNQSVPDAIQQLIGFYPIKMTVQGKEIAVECPQKASTRYKGTVLDETGQPLPYANVALLSPRDSTLITGGVTNESGLFVRPTRDNGTPPVPPTPRQARRNPYSTPVNTSICATLMPVIRLRSACNSAFPIPTIRNPGHRTLTASCTTSAATSMSIAVRR